MKKNILLVAATLSEIAPLQKNFPPPTLNQQGLNVYIFNNCKVTLLITGVGMVATAFAMGQYLMPAYDMAINAGIGGCFDYTYAIGQVVNVHEDCFPELGAEDGDDFLTVDQLGFGTNTISNAGSSWQNGVFTELPKVKGVTVNTVHGNDESIKVVKTRFNPIIESMEGAAFLFACKKHGLPCIQLRSISNYVEKRNKASWNILLAIQNLNDVLEQALLVF